MSRRSEPDGDVLLIGWGNVLLSDEGVGVHALRRLERDYCFEPAVQLEDGGTSGLDLLPLFADYRRILMLDAVAVEGRPGDIVVLRDAEIRRQLSDRLSVHHLGVSDLLGVAELMGYRPDALVMVGAVPETLELGLELSATLAERLPRIIDATLSILGEWGVASWPRDQASNALEAAPIVL